MSYNYFPYVKGRSINIIRKYLPIFRATLITVCCLCSYICTVVLEAGNRVWFWCKIEVLGILTYEQTSCRLSQAYDMAYRKLNGRPFILIQIVNRNIEMYAGYLKHGLQMYTSEKVLDFLLSFVHIIVGLVNKFTKFEQSIENDICDIISGSQISHYSRQYTPVSSHFTFPWRGHFE